MTVQTAYTRLWATLAERLGAEEAEELRKQYNQWQYQDQIPRIIARKERDIERLNREYNIVKADNNQVQMLILAERIKRIRQSIRNAQATDTLDGIDRTDPDIAIFLGQCGL